MQYLLMIYADEKAYAARPADDQKRGLEAYLAYAEALKKAGAFLGSNRLRPTGDATTVRVTNGKTQVLNGPYVETKEQLGGYALRLYTEARRRARRDAAGEYVPLASQDTSLWDARMIEHAETLLHAASAQGAFGRYQLEAALQSAHVHRRLTGPANWPHVVQLYDALLEISTSPVVAINRALAVAEIEGPHAALSALDTVAPDPRLVEYQPYWAARAALLARTESAEEVRHAYEVAIGLERDPAVRRFLQQRQSEV